MLSSDFVQTAKIISTLLDFMLLNKNVNSKMFNDTDQDWSL